MSLVLAVAVTVALVVIVPTLVVLIVQERVRRQQQRAARAATSAPLDVEALRELAAQDGAERAEMSPLLMQIYRAQFDARYGKRSDTQ